MNVQTGFSVLCLWVVVMLGISSCGITATNCADKLRDIAETRQEALISVGEIEDQDLWPLFDEVFGTIEELMEIGASLLEESGEEDDANDMRDTLKEIQADRDELDKSDAPPLRDAFDLSGILLGSVSGLCDDLQP